MEDLFEYSPPYTAATSRTRPLPQARIFSHKVAVPSRSSGKNVEYARLSEADHKYARAVIETLDEHRHVPGWILDEASGLYGQRSRIRQSRGDLLEGLLQKLRLPHPRVPGLRDEYFTLKQLRALNAIIDDVNAHIGGDGTARVVVPRGTTTEIFWDRKERYLNNTTSTSSASDSRLPCHRFRPGL